MMLAAVAAVASSQVHSRMFYTYFYQLHSFTEVPVVLIQSKITRFYVVLWSVRTCSINAILRKILRCEAEWEH